MHFHRQLSVLCVHGPRGHILSFTKKKKKKSAVSNKCTALVSENIIQCPLKRNILKSAVDLIALHRQKRLNIYRSILPDFVSAPLVVGW